MTASQQWPKVGSSTRPVTTWSVASLGVLALWLAVLLGLVHHYGSHGFQFGLIFASCTAYFLSRLPYRLVPFRHRVWTDLDLVGAIGFSLCIGMIANFVCTALGRQALLDVLAMGATVLIWRSTMWAKLVIALVFAIVYGLLIRLQLYGFDHLVGCLIRGLLLGIVLSLIDRGSPPQKQN